jgi:hypothetical protein
MTSTWGQDDELIGPHRDLHKLTKKKVEEKPLISQATSYRI